MGLYDDLRTQKYLDPVYGTCSNLPYTSGGNINCDNPSLFSAEAMLLSNSILWPGYSIFFSASQTSIGFMHRFPGDAGNISVDELIGAATLDRQIATMMLAYAENHFFIFQPQGGKLTLASWMARFINFPPYLKHRARRLKWYDFWNKMAWSIACVLSVLSDGTSGKILMWVQIQKMQGNYWLCDQAIRFWKWFMKNQYPGGLKTVMYIYFGAGHPFTSYAPEEF